MFRDRCAAHPGHLAAGGSLALFAPDLAQVAVADEPAFLLIPQPERERLEAADERDGLHRLKQRLGLVAFLEVVVRNARAQVVDVVEADVAREPLQHLRQLVERTALERGRDVVPVARPFPVHAIELVLHVEEPDAGGAGHRHDHQLNEEVRLDPEDRAERGRHPGDAQVGPEHRVAVAPICVVAREPELNQEHIERPDHEEDDRIAREAVREPLPARRLEVFLHGQRPDVAHAAPIEIARRRVMRRVLPPPVEVRA